jgi:hypothetical protein
MARENRTWGYDRIVGALYKLAIGSQTKLWATFCVDTRSHQRRTHDHLEEFIRSHMDVLAGTDFFTVEVLTWRGLITYYILFLHRDRQSLGGITRYPDSCWMEQVARNATMEGTGYLNRCRYLLHDRDTKFCREFRETLAAGGVNA